MKQFSDIGQQTNQICDPWENGNKQGKPYDCPDFMPWGITQTVEKEVESWVEFWGNEKPAHRNQRVAPARSN